jgi:hypothetical protein
MAEKREYPFLRTVADITGNYGRIIVGVLFVLGLLCGWSKGGFVPGVMWGFVFGLFIGVPLVLVFALFIGVPLVVLGQWVSVSLDQSELLEEIRDALKKG